MNRIKLVAALVVWGILAALGGVTVYRAYVSAEHDRKLEETAHRFLAPLREFTDICGDDANRYCGSVPMAEVPGCLKGQQDKLTQACRELVFRK